MATKRQRERELQAILDRARRNESSPQRKHHLVPASYLRRWAESGRVRVTEVDARTSYDISPAKACRITDFYRLDGDGIQTDIVPPLLFATLLGDVESRGKEIVDVLVSQPSAIDPEQMAHFALFLAFQYTRGAMHRSRAMAMANELIKMQFADMSDDGIRGVLASQGKEPSDEEVRDSRRFLDELRNDEITVAPPDALLVALAGQSAVAVGEHFLTRAWIVCRTPGNLVTCDEPVVTVGGPGFPRDEAAGVALAGVILFPLSPQYLLVMMRDDLASANGIVAHRSGRLLRDELDHLETIDVCLEITMNAHRWTFEQPSRRVASSFRIPPAPPAAVTEEIGETQEGDEIGTIIRTYRPTRWRSRDLPSPWPVAKWWPNRQPMPGQESLLLAASRRVPPERA